MEESGKKIQKNLSKWRNPRKSKAMIKSSDGNDHTKAPPARIFRIFTHPPIPTTLTFLALKSVVKMLSGKRFVPKQNCQHFEACRKQQTTTMYINVEVGVSTIRLRTPRYGKHKKPKL
jgi:hypothetical protein